MIKTYIKIQLCRRYYLAILFCLSAFFNSVDVFALSGYVGDVLHLSKPSIPFGAIDKGCQFSSSASELLVYSSCGSVEILEFFEGTRTVTCDYYYMAQTGTSSLGQAIYTSYHESFDYKITCNDIELTGIPQSLSLTVGDQTLIDWSYYPSSKQKPKVEFSSSWNGVATVDDYGYIRAVGIGNATITVKNHSGYDKYISVTVKGQKLVLSADPNSGEVSAGTIVTLTAKSNGSTVSGCDIYYTLNGETPSKWSTHYGSGITINSDCTLKAIAYCDGYEDSDVLTESYTVSSPDPTGITVSPGSYRLAIGETKTLSYTLTPSGATADVTWRSAATSVATVSSLSGTVTGISEGTARIWAETSNGLSDYCDITVYKVVPTSIQLSPSSCTLSVGSKKQLSYTVSPSNAEYTVSFKSSQPSVASVTSKGEVTALSGGQTTITVTTDNGCSSECIVTVPPQPISISLPPTATMTLHTTKTLTPTMQPANALATLSWTTSDASVATVSNEGKVTACKVGQATITVTTDNGLTASCLVTIPAPHYWLQAWQKNGMTAAFSFSEHPEVTLNGTKIVVTSGATVVEYQGSDFSHFTVVDNANDPTVVDVGSPQSGSASPRLSRHGSGWLVLTGCSPDTNVTVHNISGHLVATAKTDKQGGAELQLSKLGKGIFIIKIKETTFKITQR